MRATLPHRRSVGERGGAGTAGWSRVDGGLSARPFVGGRADVDRPTGERPVVGRPVVGRAVVGRAGGARPVVGRAAGERLVVGRSGRGRPVVDRSALGRRSAGVVLRVGRAVEGRAVDGRSEAERLVGGRPVRGRRSSDDPLAGGRDEEGERPVGGAPVEGRRSELDVRGGGRPAMERLVGGRLRGGRLVVGRSAPEVLVGKAERPRGEGAGRPPSLPASSLRPRDSVDRGRSGRADPDLWGLGAAPRLDVGDLGWKSGPLR